VATDSELGGKASTLSLARLEKWLCGFEKLFKHVIFELFVFEQLYLPEGRLEIFNKREVEITELLLQCLQLSWCLHRSCDRKNF
jgi:hypothetical protein